MLSTSSYRFGTLAIVALVALRLAIGWHFFREGADKLISGDFHTEGFMRIAKGPLEPVFRGMIWDADGLARLDKDATLTAFEKFEQDAAGHYGFDEKQIDRAEAALKYRTDQLDWYYEVNAEDLRTYHKGLERRDRNRVAPERTEVASLYGQRLKIEADLTKDRTKLLQGAFALWKGYEADINAIATQEQAKRGRISMPMPGRKPLDTKFQDQVVPVFDLTVGLLLLAGLFSRVASLAGAGFLCTIALTQWPWAVGAVPAYYQIIEMVALLVLATTGAGRFAGLDFFVSAIADSMRSKGRTSEAQTAASAFSFSKLLWQPLPTH